jgi:hypothetical protein
MTQTATKRTLDKLRKEQWTVGIVEKWNQFSKTRHDLFGFVDLVAIRDGETLGIQATSYSNIAARVKKIKEHENYLKVKRAGWNLEVWGWKATRKVSKTTNNVYYRHTCRVVSL